MKVYTVVKDGERINISATNPLSACKKAFRSPHGWHWEERDDKRLDVMGSALVLVNDRVVLKCILEDNG